MRCAKQRLLAVLVTVAAAVAAADRPPNIVLLIGDDHGYPYFGFMGDRNVVTPNMDALAGGGFTFGTAHVTASYCRPSLRSIITGLHPVRYMLLVSWLTASSRRTRSAPWRWGLARQPNRSEAARSHC